ncbi:MAG: 1-deoxy-D-xylulose-5-phosphate reductoisomerase [Pseudomonadota bacterium]
MDAQSQQKTRSIAILGATGTIGANTLDVVKRHPDRFSVELVTANRSALELAEIAKKVGAKHAIVADPTFYDELRNALAGTKIRADCGLDAISDAIEPPIELVVAAIVGTAGLSSAYRAVEKGMSLALANKECLVAAGDLFNAGIRKFGGELLTLDSEHNAIFQVLGHSGDRNIDAITLTASGGPFRTWSLAEMADVDADRAVKHPQWSMGPKISVDSATMMNKGLELIEARVLFGDVCQDFRVCVHPQSIVHGFVSYRDGSVIAQMSPPDMRIPIAVALGWPDRIESGGGTLSLPEIAQLTFEDPDYERFPALALAKNAMETGQEACLVLNAANEIAVDGFLNGQIGFLTIAQIVEETLDRLIGRSRNQPMTTIDDVLAFDERARQTASDILHHAHLAR